MGRTKGSKKSKGDGCLAPESMTLMCSKPGGGRIFAATEGVVLNALKLDSVTPVAGEYDRHAGVSLGCQVGEEVPDLVEEGLSFGRRLVREDQDCKTICSTQ